MLPIALSVGAYAVLVAMVFVPLELLAPRVERPPRWSGVDAGFATLGAALGHGLVALTAGALLALGKAFGTDLGLSVWVAVPLGLLLFELTGYAYHRAAHAVPVLWAFHEVHHSSERMDWWAAFRQHPVELWVTTVLQNLPLVLLGLPLGSHVLIVMLLRLNAQFVHANVRTPSWLEGWVATPHFHHRHHALDGEARNFSVLFPWIDRLFGTWDARGATHFGVPGSEERTFVEGLWQPFRQLATRSTGSSQAPEREGVGG